MPTNSILSFDSIISFGSKFSFYCKDDLLLERVEKRPIGSLKLTRDHTTISILACFSHEPNVFITWLQQFVNCYVFDNLRYVATSQSNLHNSQITLVPELATEHSPVHMNLKPILKRIDAPNHTYDVNSVKRVRFDADSYVHKIDESSSLNHQKPLPKSTAALFDVSDLPIDDVEIELPEQSLPNLPLTRADLKRNCHATPDLYKLPKPENFHNEIDAINATIKKLRQEKKVLKKQRNRSRLAALSTWFSRSEKDHDVANDEQLCNINDTEHILSHRSVTSARNLYLSKPEDIDLVKHSYNDSHSQFSLKHKFFSFRHRENISSKRK